MHKYPISILKMINYLSMKFAFGLLFLTLFSNQHVTAQEAMKQNCDAITEIDRVFRFKNLILFGLKDALWKAELGEIAETVESFDLQPQLKSVSNVYSAVDFEFQDNCDRTNSHQRFCATTKVYNNQTFWFGYNKASHRQIESDFYQNLTGHGVPSFSYIAGDYLPVNNNDSNLLTPNFEHYDNRQQSISQRANWRVRESISTLMMNIAWNEYIRFRGISFDSINEALYTIGSLNSTKMNTDHWQAGQFVLFRANLTASGFIGDSYHAYTFEKEMKGIFSYNGRQYILGSDGKTFQEYFNDTMGAKNYTIKEMFCSKDSPLQEAPLKVVLNRNVAHKNFSDPNLLPNFAKSFFPRRSSEAKTINNPMLEGWWAVAIIIILSICLILSCALHISTIFEDNKIDRQIRERLNQRKELLRAKVVPTVRSVKTTNGSLTNLQSKSKGTNVGGITSATKPTANNTTSLGTTGQQGSKAGAEKINSRVQTVVAAPIPESKIIPSKADVSSSAGVQKIDSQVQGSVQASRIVATPGNISSSTGTQPSKITSNVGPNPGPEVVNNSTQMKANMPGSKV